MFENTNRYMVVLFILSIFFIFVVLRNYIIEQSGNSKKESFIQQPPFIVKRNENSYDEFTSKIYDVIFHPEKESDYVINNAFKLTEPTPSHTTILDIGCGTGELLNKLNQQKYTNIYGLEKSNAMATECINKYPYLKIKNGDASNDPMLFDKSTFTHIFCVGMTIYEIKDKIAFFRNCYYWLKPNSYLILHLVNKNNFNTIVPAGEKEIFLMMDKKNKTTTKNINQYFNERITNTEIDFEEFKYKSEYDFTKPDIVIFTETFQDNTTYKIRKNERVMYMPNDMENILYDAQYCGFLVVSQINYKAFNGDENQFLFILERPL